MSEQTYELPSTDKNVFTVYSIKPCPYCKKVKQLLKDKGEQYNVINCNEYRKNNRDDFLKFINELTQTDHKTFPMVFHGTKFIGGFDKTSIYFEQLESIKNMKEVDDF